MRNKKRDVFEVNEDHLARVREARSHMTDKDEQRIISTQLANHRANTTFAKGNTERINKQIATKLYQSENATANIAAKFNMKPDTLLQAVRNNRFICFHKDFKTVVMAELGLPVDYEFYVKQGGE